MQLFNKILAATLFAFLTILSLLFFMLPDRPFSEMENRMLQIRPVFSWASLITGKFSLAAENYLADQFAFRDLWIGIKSAAELALQKKDNNGVYFGKEGYLLQKPENLDADVLAENIAVINRFAESVPARVSFLLAPPSGQILADKLPPFAEPQQTGTLFAQIKEGLSPAIQCIDPCGALTAHREEYIYYKTDHHWTTRGAYYAYRETGPVLEFVPLGIEDFTIEQAGDNFYGTLHAKSGRRFLEPDVVQLFKPKKGLSCQVEYVNEKKTGHSLYAGEHLKEKDKYAVFLDGNHALVKVTAPNQTGRKLLLIKDSYANCLVPFLANHFDEIHIIDLRHCNQPLQAYIEQHGLSEILFVYNSLSFAEDPAIRKIGAQ